ncbi:MAG TPA: glycosyltransferase family 2 protein [Chloroflexia bacterium]|nr:glycosyltransferase family 2 protein [Chloroflexia bacterium]
MPDLLAVLGWLAGVVLLLVEVGLVFLVGYLLFLTTAAVVVWLGQPAERLGADGAPQMATPDAGLVTASGRWPAPHTRFTVLIPAHDEELLIRRVVGSLLAIDYPRELYSLHVIADNCTDRTAELARAEGATVHERQDPDRRGKGYALRWLFGPLLADSGSGDAFVIVDADSLVNQGFLRALDRRLGAGAVAIQAYDTVLNIEASWGTALRYVAFALLHYLRPLGRKLFGGSAGLKGNGMCFRRDVLEGMDWGAFSVTEDLQFHLDLLLGGHVVEFAPDAIVWSEMPGSLQAAHAQNMRWESGRLDLLTDYVPRLVRAAVARRRFVLFDAAMENIIPPFSVTFAAAVGALGAALIWGHPLAIGLGFFALLGQVVYTFAGLLLVGAPGKVFFALLYAPFYVAWKLLMWLPMAIGRRNRSREWVRTAR